MSYKYFPKQTNEDGTKEYRTVIRLSDNAIIPIDNNNTDYKEVLAWIDDGNTISSPDE